MAKEIAVVISGSAAGPSSVTTTSRDAGAKQPAPGLERVESVLSEKDSAKAPHPRWAYIKSLAWLRAVLLLGLLYCAGLLVVYWAFSRLPTLEQLAAEALPAANAKGKLAGKAAAATQAALQGGQSLALRVPRSHEELRAVRATLELYRTRHAPRLLTVMAAAYVFLQAFMIPGSFVINLLAGGVLPFWAALAFVAVVSTVGAAASFWLSAWLLRDMATALFPARIQTFSAELARHSSHLLNYLLFLRCMDFLLPGWFINMASPIVGVPFGTFLVATAVGHTPINVMTIHAGRTLQTLQSLHELYSAGNILFLLSLGLLSLVPVAVRRRQQRRQAQRTHGRPARDSRQASPPPEPGQSA